MASTKIVTGKVRFSYAHVFQPTSMDDGKDPKYNISLLIPKSDKATIKKIQDAIELAKEEGKAKLGGKIPANLKTPLRDGDSERPDDAAYAGHYFINANSAQKPGVVDKDLNPIITPEEFYSGCYGRASINFYAYNVSGNKGIAAGLNNLQKLEDGERLSGGSTAEEDFGSESDDLL
jgi:hypothetical protein